MSPPNWRQRHHGEREASYPQRTRESNRKLGLTGASEEICWPVVETLQGHALDSKIKLRYLIKQSDVYFRDKEKIDSKRKFPLRPVLLSNLCIDGPFDQKGRIAVGRRS